METGFDALFNKTVEFRDCELLEYAEGFIRIRTIVNSSNTNPYGMAHGGYLYTLCDSLAGLLSYSTGFYTVTMQANINYLKEAREKDILCIEGRIIHDGKTTKIADVEIRNQEEILLCKASFTMYVIDKVEE